MAASVFKKLITLRPWLTAARPIGHGMIALPLLLGQGLAYAHSGQFDWWWFCVAQLLGVFVQIHTLYLNDYADEPLDRNNHNYWFSGGSRVIPEGQLTGAQLYKASLLPVLGLVLLTVVAMAMGRSWLPLFTAFAIVASWSYSLPPLKSSYRGWGELHQGISCGVALPLCAYYLQTGHLNAFPWWALLPVFLIFFASNIVTALPDVVSDKQGGKRTYPVRHGAQRAKRDAVLLLLLAAVAIAAWQASQGVQLPISLVVVMPAVASLWLARFSGPVARTEDTKRFMLLTLFSQLWLILFWVLQLFVTVS